MSPARPPHSYVLITPYWPCPGHKGGIATLFKYLADELHRQGHRVEVLHVRWHSKSFLHAKQTETDSASAYPVSTLYAEWPRKFGYRYLKILSLPIASLKVFFFLASKSRHTRIITTNYRGLTLLHSLFRPDSAVLMKVSTTWEQIQSYIPFHKKGVPGSFKKLEREAECFWEHFAIRAAAMKSSHTRSHIRWLARRLGLSERDFHLIPHGLPKIFPEKQSPALPPLVLFLGKLEVRKGIDILCQAIPPLLEKHADLRFVLAGNDPEGWGNKLAEKLPAKARTRLEVRGMVSDSDRDLLLRSSYLMVSPSRYESFGLTYLEAMSLGIPVIGTRGGGSDEVIGEGGILVAPEDAAALVEAMDSLLENPEKRARYSDQALAQAARFSISECADQVDKVFTDLDG